MYPDIDFIVVVMLIGLMILIPIVGLTARFSLKPIVDAIVRLRESTGPYAVAAPLVEQRLAGLEAEIQNLRAMLESSVERAEFDHQLYGGTSSGARLSPAALPVRGAGDDLTV